MEQKELLRRRNIKKKTSEPDKLKVVILNDDVTTFDFVIKMLEEVFFKDEQEAVRLAVETDSNGRAEVGIYLADIALSKVDLATQMARSENFPLRLITENV